jgi:hypothetical protein
MPKKSIMLVQGVNAAFCKSSRTLICPIFYI